MTVFNRRAVRQHRDRAAGALSAHDFLFRETAERLADRLTDINRRFDLGLDLGCHGGELAETVQARERIGRFVQCDLSPAMAALARSHGEQATIAADEEALPFAPASFDVVVSNLSLHWVNDLPGTLKQVLTTLKPDGLFLAAMLGGQTLRELRDALTRAEAEIEGGLSQRVSPLAEVRDAGALLQRAGFALPVADRETITVSYGDPLRLMTDLRAMGESNAVLSKRRTLTRRSTLFRAAEIYIDDYGNAAGRIDATFEVIFMTAWAPHPDQQQPLPRGSARHRLADAVDGREYGPGEEGPTGG